MMTVHEVSKRTGISIRALQYYDRIGLLPPTTVTDAGYRLYDDAALLTLQQILLFRELEFPLGDIKRILNDPNFDRAKALEQQIRLLKLKRERLDRIIDLAQRQKDKGGDLMDFSAFDSEQIERYAKDAKVQWGDTKEYREFEAKDLTKEQQRTAGAGLMELFRAFAALKDGAPDAPEAQAAVKKLQDYISANFYSCSNDVLKGLGQMYGAGGEFTENIDAFAGAGTAAFAAKAIEAYCKRN
ncbi:MAG: MerR family transcriptional regulator [Clostridia bacterium]|nr:MerR family transcriptional regulator [Clostridia bacterium]